MPSCEADFMIIGSGIAGLFAAFMAKEYGTVLLLTKECAEESNTGKAQGGIAAAIDEGDSPFLHLEDTLQAGAGLCDPETVEILVTEGPARVMQLVELGVRFDREGSAWALGQEGAHRRRRILHASDATGWEIARGLIRECRSAPGVMLRENCFLVDLLRDRCTGRCAGALIMDSRSGEFSVYRAKAVIVATGGVGQLYLNTTNPAVATGDGMAAAYRAGAALMDLEFVQFHPTALAIPGAPRFLISEAVRGEGALLLNARGERFMPGCHEMAELAPRDVVSRAIVREMRKTGESCVYLDFSHLDQAKMQQRFPNIWRTCDQFGLDLSKGQIPVAPAAHYIMGGIATGSKGETGIPGFYACGEVACNGVHGANRLASNSLLEGLVFGARAVEDAHRFIEEHPYRSDCFDPLQQPRTSDWDVLWGEVTGRLRSLLWEQVGIIRNGAALAAALSELQAISCAYPRLPASRRGVEARNLLTLGELAARAALIRKESRGGHFREDFPQRNDSCWLRHIVFQR